MPAVESVPVQLLADALAPTDDGYDHLRGIERMGTVLQDGAQDAYNPEPKED